MEITMLTRIFAALIAALALAAPRAALMMLLQAPSLEPSRALR